MSSLTIPQEVDTETKESPQYWDSLGYLIRFPVQINQDDSSSKADSDVDLYEPKKLSKEEIDNMIIHLSSPNTPRKSHQEQIHAQTTPSPKQIHRSKSSSSEFFERQEKSFMRQNAFKNEKPSTPVPTRSFISPQSRRLAERSKFKEGKPKRPSSSCSYYSYKPDLSLTQDVTNSVQGLPIECVETTSILRDIELKTLEVHVENQRNKNCTFRPELNINQRLVRKAIKNKAKRDEKRKNNITESDTVEEPVPKKKSKKAKSRYFPISKLIIKQ